MKENLIDMPSAFPQNVTQVLADWSHGEDADLASDGANDDFITK